MANHSGIDGFFWYFRFNKNENDSKFLRLNFVPDYGNFSLQPKGSELLLNVTAPL